jgi:hemerythrin
MNAPSSPVFDPAAIPEIALETMNATHREVVEIINRLGALLKKRRNGNPEPESITEAMEEWVSHTRAHFEAENRLMREHGFPAYPIHSGEHARVLQHIENLQQNWLQQQDAAPLADFLFEEWPNWFLMHVNSMDTVTAQFLSQRMG